MGKLILFAAVCFAVYWGYTFYKKTTTNNLKEYDPLTGHPVSVDDLILYFKNKIDTIEADTMIKSKTAESNLAEYKRQLEECYKLKQQLNK